MANRVHVHVANPSGEGGETASGSVADVARQLGVSERTVYRRLKCGRMGRVRVSDKKNNTDTYPKSETHDSISNSSFLNPEMSDNMSDKKNDIDIEERLELMRGQISEKDQQISKLLQNQQELTQTVNRLHEQMYELARIVLAQTKPAPAEKEMPEGHGAEHKEGSRWTLASFLRGKTTDSR